MPAELSGGRVLTLAPDSYLCRPVSSNAKTMARGSPEHLMPNSESVYQLPWTRTILKLGAIFVFASCIPFEFGGISPPHKIGARSGGKHAVRFDFQHINAGPVQTVRGRRERSTPSQRSLCGRPTFLTVFYVSF